MRGNNKKILLGIILLLVVMTSVFLVFNKKEEYKELPKVKIKNDNINNSLAIMVESNYQTEEYTKWEDNSFPTNGYTLNRIKSGCIDNNGQNVDALTYNEETKKISLKANGSVKCYLYYDSLFKGKGTKEEPYEINYIEDLVRLSNSVNKDSNNYNSKYFVLKRNLDFNTNESYMKYNDTGFGDINGVSGIEGIKEELTNQEGSGFIPIGYGKTFEGNIDGKNNKISNLWIYNKNNGHRLSFIGQLEKGSVNNLTIQGNIQSDVNTDIGGIVGGLQNSTMNNCVSEVNIKASSLVVYGIGGLVGTIDGDSKIINSSNKADLILDGGDTVGGILGNMASGGKSLLIENSYNYGNIILNHSAGVGGLIGDTHSSTDSKTIIKNSANYGEIKVNSEVNSAIYAGGLIGISKKEIEILNSHNEGIVDIKGINGLYVGGIIGNSNNKTEITNSYNLGEINSSTSGNSDNSVGGIVGSIFYNDKAKISKIETSYNKGTINGGVRTGGIIGKVYNPMKIIINKCYNSGNLTAQEDTIYTGSVEVGGILCQIYNGPTVYILNSYNIGILKSNATKTNGNSSGMLNDINGNTYIGTGVIINSYNLGNVSAKNIANSFGILFSNGEQLILNNVYNVGNLEAPEKYTILKNTSNGNTNVKNTYYKEIAGVQESDKGDLPEAYSMTDVNMKNTDGNDSNSLLYKLNQNVQSLNSAGLSSIDSETIGTDLDDYTLSSWKIDPTTGYPTLDYNLETE